jgi:hypothetical protein
VDTLRKVNWPKVFQKFVSIFDGAVDFLNNMVFEDLRRNNYSFGNSSFEELLRYWRVTEMNRSVWTSMEVMIMWFIGRHLFINKIGAMEFAKENPDLRRSFALSDCEAFARKLRRAIRIYILSEVTKSIEYHSSIFYGFLSVIL